MRKIKIKLFGGKLPEYKHESDACADCYVKTGVLHKIKPFRTEKIPLGFGLELPEGYEAVIRPRSSISADGLLIHTGTIDSGFRGEVHAIVTNLTNADKVICGDSRICQMKIQQAEQFEFVEADALSESDRGENGFGSTGV